MDWVYLSVGGFLLGSFLYTGWDTTHYEPEARPGYILIGAGILLSVAINGYVDSKYDVHNGYRLATLLTYAAVAAGLVLIVRARRKRRKKGGE